MNKFEESEIVDKVFFFQINKEIEDTCQKSRQGHSSQSQDQENPEKYCQKDYDMISLNFKDESIYQQQIPSPIQSSRQGFQSLFDFNTDLRDILEKKNYPPQIKQPFSQEKNSQFRRIFKERNFDEKSGNVVRLLVDMAVNSLPQYQHCYPQSLRQSMVKSLTTLRNWHKQSKKNVYNLEHLCNIFGDQIQSKKQSAKISRKLFNKIIKDHTIQFLKKPKSQIRNKVHYLRVAKIYMHRCRNKTLSQRLQSR